MSSNIEARAWTIVKCGMEIIKEVKKERNVKIDSIINKVYNLGEIWDNVFNQEDIMPKSKPKLLGGSVRPKGNQFEGRIMILGKTHYIYSAEEAECITELNKLYAKGLIAKKNHKKRKDNPEPIKFHEWLNKWLIVYKQPTVSDYTYYLYTRIIRNHIKKGLPNVELDKITNMDVQIFLNKFIDNKQRTGETAHNLLKECLKQAVINGLCQRNPAEGIKRKKHTRTTGQPLTREEERQFLKDIEPLIYRDYFKVCLYSGARRSEALRLTVSDIDWKNNKLHIPGTKTQTSDRTIPIFENLKKVLQKITPAEDGRLFPFLGDAVTKYFKQVCPKHRLHDLRTTFISRCYEAEIPIKIVSDWAGHKTSEVTIQHYLKISKEMEEKFTKKLNDFSQIFPQKSNHNPEKNNKKEQ
ncbi:MAG: site-specific integrase [Firmicutes bacterium]|nr:site-specific integrase [Bacillota bacterium]